jgi:hypothetical protein
MTRRLRKSKHVLSTISVAMFTSVAFYAGASAASMSCEWFTSISYYSQTQRSRSLNPTLRARR